jgi:hypothetical protein
MQLDACSRNFFGDMQGFIKTFRRIPDLENCVKVFG